MAARSVVLKELSCGRLMTGAVNKALEIRAIHGDSGSGKKGGGMGVALGLCVLLGYEKGGVCNGYKCIKYENGR